LWPPGACGLAERIVGFLAPPRHLRQLRSHRTSVAAVRDAPGSEPASFADRLKFGTRAEASRPTQVLTVDSACSKQSGSLPPRGNFGLPAGSRTAPLGHRSPGDHRIAAPVRRFRGEQRLMLAHPRARSAFAIPRRRPALAAHRFPTVLDGARPGTARAVVAHHCW
jgi:hypothetical protein